jgi:hypothetical protein
MTVSTSVRRAGTVSAATVALVLSGGGLAFAAALPTDATGTTLTSTATGLLPTSSPLPAPLPSTSPLPLPLPTTSPTPTPTQSPTPTSSPAPAQTLLPALPTGGSGGTAPTGSSPTGSSGSGSTGSVLSGGGTATRAGAGSSRSTVAVDNTGNETYPAGSSSFGDPTSWALPAYDLLQPSFDLPAATSLSAPGVGSQPLVAGSQPELVQLAGAATPQVAPTADGGHGDRQVAGLVIVFAVVTIGGVAAGHASLLQQRLAHRTA